VAHTLVPTALLTFGTEGRYFFGVKAVRLDVGGKMVAVSNIAWSDVEGNSQGGIPTGISYMRSPKDPGGLR
jgi:hypothetical protein